MKTIASYWVTLLTVSATAAAQPLYTEVTRTHLPSGLAGRCMDSAAGDADGDGDLDLALAMEFEPNVLLLNDGAGLFRNASAQLPRTEHDQCIRDIVRRQPLTRIREAPRAVVQVELVLAIVFADEHEIEIAVAVEVGECDVFAVVLCTRQLARRIAE